MYLSCSADFIFRGSLFGRSLLLARIANEPRRIAVFGMYDIHGSDHYIRAGA